MGVIALTVSGDQPSIVTSKDAFSREGCAILILDGDSQQLDGHGDECNATYDLRVGHIFRDHRSQGGQEVGPKDEIRLRPGNAVIIQTEETVAFPKWRFGQILPKVSLLQEGVANTPSKVDPGYEGHLLITTFNHADEQSVCAATNDFVPCMFSISRGLFGRTASRAKKCAARYKVRGGRKSATGSMQTAQGGHSSRRRP
jgi:deoxycytidine triphosphate deaminase